MATKVKGGSAVDFDFGEITFEQIIFHRILAKGPDGYVDPECAQTTHVLTPKGQDALQKRLTDSLASSVHGMEVAVRDQGPGTFFDLGVNSMSANKLLFVKNSKQIAEKLARAQLSTNSPPGMLAVIKGRISAAKLPYIAAIKAETDDGFRDGAGTAAGNIDFIQDLFLTRTQRMYKIGLLVRIKNTANIAAVGNYRIFLFDHLLTTTETRGAAAFFLTNFLGMTSASSNKKLTQVFYESTITSINTAAKSADERLAYFEALRSELRSEKITFSVKGFATEHLPTQIREQYVSFMSAENFPKQAIQKDTAYVAAKIRARQRMNFGNNVEIRTPANRLDELVKLVETDDDGFSTVRIKGEFIGAS